MEEYILVHFLGGHRLKITGDHVENFIKKYKEAITKGATHFYSEAESSILINLANVTFIQQLIEEKEQIHE